MKPSSFLFLTYRLIEKTFGIRAESIIGHYLFRYITPIELKNCDGNPNYLDKRSTWEALRLRDGGETIRHHLTKLFSAGNIGFENSMETSIRGINCIISLQQDLRDPAENAQANRYISAAYYHSILCPDLYLRRSGITFFDESNNHRFYNLLLWAFYELHHGKKVSYKALEAFVFDRLIDNFFYDEGSSFYHFGIVDSLLKLRIYAEAGGSKETFSDAFNSWLDNAQSNLSVMKEINFGDRDGTTIAPWMNTDQLYKTQETEINTEKFVLLSNEQHLLCLRKSNWCNLGTQGHVHDDFGQIIYAANSSKLLDIGIFRYAYEPLYARKKYHNFPLVRSHPKMKFFRKFERMVPYNKRSNNWGSYFSVTEIGQLVEVERVLNAENFLVEDFIHSEYEHDTAINWRFYIDGTIHTGDVTSKPHLTINVENEMQFTLHPDASFRVCESVYFPEYGQSKRCNVLLIRLKINLIPRRNVKILAISFAKKAEV